MDFDYLIIGAGISGAAAGYELSLHGRALIVDMEAQPGYHSTGRSAALYTPNYGPDLVRKINKLSADFLNSPPADFTSDSLLTHRGMMTVVFDADAAQLPSLLDDGEGQREQISLARMHELAPFLQSDKIHSAIYEHGVFDMDVSVLHQGYLAGFKRRGGTLICGAKISALTRVGKQWQTIINGASCTAGVVVNASGAWADEIGALANATPIGLQPKRRTAILVDVPSSVSLASVPAIDFHGIDNYLKPEAQLLMVSPGDETLVDAQDIQADDYDVAVLVDWFERSTTIEVNRVAHQWAGLRSFTAAGTPVVGFDPSVDGFFWLAGQGGYGIMMASALGRASASLITRGGLPDDFNRVGVDPQALGIR